MSTFFLEDNDNRVVLKPIGSHKHDFVNASYVDVSRTIINTNSIAITRVLCLCRDIMFHGSLLLVKVNIAFYFCNVTFFVQSISSLSISLKMYPCQLST